MYCPKCGSQNGEGTKYCRGCGADVSNVPAALEGRSVKSVALAEKHIELFSSGLRGLFVGIGFLIASGVAFGISIRFAVLGIFALMFASFFIGTGVARLFQSRGIKKLRESENPKPTPELKSGEPEYFKPARSIYETDDLTGTPLSVTDHTTKHLQMDPDMPTPPKK